MSESLSPKPRILVIGGLDPTGGAGLVADIETASAFGCRTLALATALTVQDTRGVSRFEPVAVGLLREQAEVLLGDLVPDAIKIGMLGSRGVAELVAGLLERLKAVPVVLDPVLTGGAGGSLSDPGLVTVIRDRLADNCTVITPNQAELSLISDTGRFPLACPVLVTGTDAATSGDVTHELLTPGSPARSWHWRRLPGKFHGSGCTLASAIASRLAFGVDLVTALEGAMAYTWQALAQATDRGAGQWLPTRGPAKEYIKGGQRGVIR